MNRKKVIIDCDPGIDDSLAIMLALASPELEVLGITVTAGNAPVDMGAGNAGKVLDFCHRSDIPVYAGAGQPLVKEYINALDTHGADGLGESFLDVPKDFHVQEKPAVEFLAETLGKGGVSVIALGPLTNPAKPEMFLLGVYDEYLVEPVAKVLTSLGVKRGFVVFGQDRLDEISASAPTSVCEIRDGFYRTSVIKPEDFGLARGTKDEIVGGTPQENAQITREILSGKQQGTKRNIVLMNAGAALYIAGKADSMADGTRNIKEISFSTTPTAEEAARPRRLATSVRIIKEMLISVSCMAIGIPIFRIWRQSPG